MPKSTLKLIKKHLRSVVQERIMAEPSPPLQVNPAVDDFTAWLEMYGPVTPVASGKNYQHLHKKPSPHPRPTQLSYPTVSHPSIPLMWTSQQEGSYRVGMRSDTLKKMRRKTWQVQAELDLHGMTADEADIASQHFLIKSQQQGLQRLRIIHGKGLSSPNQEPVLKKRIYHWLMNEPLVLAFTHPIATQGGSGVVLILIKNSSAALITLDKHF